MNMTSKINDLLCGDVENYFQCYSLHVFILRIALNRPCTKQLVNLVRSVITQKSQTLALMYCQSHRSEISL